MRFWDLRVVNMKSAVSVKVIFHWQSFHSLINVSKFHSISVYIARFL
jgi:hypothetical protein